MATHKVADSSALMELLKRMERASDVTVPFRSERRHKDDVADALKELKKRVKKSGILHELRRREEYVAPSKKRRLKRDASRKQRRRDERRIERQNREEF